MNPASDSFEKKKSPKNLAQHSGKSPSYYFCFVTLILTAWEFKKLFCKHKNKSWMVEAKYFLKCL
jgi:hypothetical protein